MANSIVILGANGLLGTALQNKLLNSNDIIYLIARSEEVYFKHNFTFIACDLSDFSKLKLILKEINPDIIINAAAYTAVDKAESEQDLASKLNTDLPNLLAELSNSKNHIVHISTDYIYDGLNGPYAETDSCNPLSVYGKTKYLGDLALLEKSKNKITILRAIVVYGIHPNPKKINFLTWLVRELKLGKKVNIVNDQFGTFTFVEELADCILTCIDKSIKGVYNISSEEQLSRFEMSRIIAKELGLDLNLINAIKTSDLKQAAIRPLISGFKIVKAKTDLNFRPLPLAENIKHLKNKLLELV
jgi:dTDP-4-dehydrorhamnose reductase